MTKRDFELIAGAIKDQVTTLRECKKSEAFSSELQAMAAQNLRMLCVTACELANRIADEHPRFQIVQFLEACGLHGAGFDFIISHSKSADDHTYAYANLQAE